MSQRFLCDWLMPLATALPFIHGVCPDSVQSIYCCGPVPCVLAANLWLIARLAGPWAVRSVCLLSGDMLLPLGTQLMSMDGGFRWVHQGVRDDLMAAAQAGDLRPHGWHSHRSWAWPHTPVVQYWERGRLDPRGLSADALEHKNAYTQKKRKWIYTVWHLTTENWRHIISFPLCLWQGLPFIVQKMNQQQLNLWPSRHPFLTRELHKTWICSCHK